MVAMLVFEAASGLISHTLLCVHNDGHFTYTVRLIVNRKVYYGASLSFSLR